MALEFPSDRLPTWRDLREAGTGRLGSAALMVLDNISTIMPPSAELTAEDQLLPSEVAIAARRQQELGGLAVPPAQLDQ